MRESVRDPGSIHDAYSLQYGLLAPSSILTGNITNWHGLHSPGQEGSAAGD